MTHQERSEAIRRIALRLPRRCFGVIETLMWDADELDNGIYPGSENSWRADARRQNQSPMFYALSP